jgi:polyvinyl alcohol dehydrogenase (cytochrome)
MPRTRRTPVATVLVATLAIGLAACGSPTKSAPRPAPSPTRPPGTTAASGPSPTGADWPTFGHDNRRTGVAAGFPHITDPSIAWHTDLDSAVYGQPIVIGDTVFAATENDTVYALAAHDGAIRWQKHLGTPVQRAELGCGNIAPLGITGTMAYDPATRAVFAVTDTTGGEKTLYGLSAATGATVQRRNVDPPKGDRVAHQQRSALTVWNGRVYVAYGGHSGDCGNYIGAVVSVPTSGDGASTSYAIPTNREGGIWAPGGGVLAGDGAALLYAVGNGESTTGYDGSDSVIALAADLRLVDRFSPDTWADDNAHDLDLGTTTPTVLGDVVISAGKRGVGYVLAGGHLGGIGGELSQTPVCRSAGAMAVDGPAVYVPCLDGVQQLTVNDHKITLGWKATVPTSGTPVIGGGVLWATDWHAGVLYLLDPATGHKYSQIDVGELPHFATPSLARGMAFLPTLSGVTALR